MNASVPVVKDLVLIGGGHSHVLLLRQLGMKPIPGLRITLISPDILTPYSGMLPGVVAGHYSPEDIHIDLVPLCRFAGAQFIKAQVEDFDPYAKRVELQDRPGIEYDVLSIDIGITPSLDVPGATEHVIPVKPIGQFLKRWDGFLDRFKQGAVNSIALVGAGAGGVELCLAIHEGLRKTGLPMPKIHLVAASDTLLSEFSSDIQQRFINQLRIKNIELHTGARVSEVTQHALLNDLGDSIEADEKFWVTSASSQSWLAKTGLQLDDQGFIVTKATLQSANFDSVFATGDIASNKDYPRPKAGVFAVRQGPALFENIERYLLGKKPKAFKPQTYFLSLISTGGRHAVGARGRITIQGDWVWRWKDWIDQRFMAKFHDLPKMESVRQGGLLKDLDDQMLCGGCGSKVSANVLSEVLRDVGIDPGSMDDAAIYTPPEGQVMLHSVDSFKTFTPDNYTFAQIAVHHALSDIYAMGGTPVTALAIMTVPHGTPRKIRSTLEQLIAGSHQALEQEGVKLVGGHTTEGAELTLGFSVNGTVAPSNITKKAGLKEGQLLVLTKPLGTGTLLAADMQYKAKGGWIETALASMNQSNRAAAEILQSFNVSASTDITGFGLCGHLLEMLRASNCSAVVRLADLPALPGALVTLNQMKVFSTLHEGNKAACPEVTPLLQPAMPLVFDPQTSGGLLAGIDESDAPALVKALKQAGYTGAAVVGRVSSVGQAHVFFE